MKKTIYKCVLPLLICILLTGCWDRTEINDIAFVVSSAIDKKKDQYRVAMQIPLVGQLGGQTGGGGGTAGSKTWYVDSASGTTIREANNKLQTSLSRTINTSHRRTVIIGEDMARDGVAPVFDILTRNPQNRLTALILVSRGEARDILNTDVQLEQFPAEMIRELAIIATSRPVFLSRFMSDLVEIGSDPYAPVISASKTKPGGKGKSNLKIDGLAIFKKDRLMDIFKDEHMTATLMLLNQARQPEFIVDLPNQMGQASIQLQKSNASFHAAEKNGKLSMTIEIRAKGIIMENQSTYETRENDQYYIIQKALNRTIKKDVISTVHRLQKLKADPAGFQDRTIRSTATTKNLLKKEWEEVYKDMEVHVVPIVTIEQGGVLYKTISH
ncbi:Putative spore germination protein YfkR [Bacillus subtilis]|uniref:Ger(x)C family spore germination protein n=1 Tax=Bacillus TaxID=1386 RepID=UPI00084F1537|nr:MULTISPECIES: Ger(x)C family spore germination protein [Bacillus]AXP47463.1 Ger(x)C family spore germination protein [Bacillus subtilis subsp. subtilis]AYF10299.1 Ger(x)C family spore germination protein [Bacillus subtilis]MCL0027317.1 Ger(x)C family spore germination protein [Bacillus sp. C21]MCL8471680.1 Ger(x)C family spore germination protein [Bacillus subtilis]MDI6549487.1 Ger(x)C family spore germination protein [Bacillus subtilis]